MIGWTCSESHKYTKSNIGDLSAEGTVILISISSKLNVKSFQVRCLKNDGLSGKRPVADSCEHSHLLCSVKLKHLLISWVTLCFPRKIFANGQLAKNLNQT
jgi:hypothetical protein